MELAPATTKDLRELSALLSSVNPDLKFATAPVLNSQIFGDPDLDSSTLLKAVDKKKCIGMIQGVARPVPGGNFRIGYVKAFAVHPRAREKGAGQLLFSEIERRFQKRDVREIRVGGCPAPFLQSGVRVDDTATVSFLLKRGYLRSDTLVDMTAALGKWKAVEKPDDKALIKAAGIRKAGPRDEALLGELIRQHFPQWAYEAALGLKSGIVYIAETGGKASAFCCGDTTNPGFYGPTGTAPSEQGRGLARILLNLTLAAMKKRGHKKAVIPWVGPIPFYAKYAGATLGPVYWQFSKKL